MGSDLEMGWKFLSNGLAHIILIPFPEVSELALFKAFLAPIYPEQLF